MERNTFCRYCKKDKPISEFSMKSNGKPYKTCNICSKREKVDKKKLDKATIEQQAIVDSVINGYNVKVDAVAGSGKTTTALHIAKNCSDKKVALITYNKKLKDETNQKVIDFNFANMEVYTYHGSCLRFYLEANGELIDDLKMKECIDKNFNCIKELNLNYDIIIIDEVQDMNITYCKFIRKLIGDNKSNSPDKLNTCIVIFGDKNQCINQYNAANFRFLTMGEDIFRNNNKWVSLKLTETFRVPQEICDFLNDCMLQETRMVSRGKDGKPKYCGYKPRYFITSSFTRASEGCDWVLKEVLYYLNLKDENGKKLYKNDDIFILAPSVKNKADNQSPVILLANELSSRCKHYIQNINNDNDNDNYSSNDTMVYITNDNDCEIDEKIMKHKIVFSTHNSVKGLERKVIIIFNFDNSYFEYFDKETEPHNCPNRLYVGVTRSQERLSMIHHFENDYLPFLKGKDNEEKINNIKKYCDVNPTDGGGNIFKNLDTKELKDTKPIKHAVTDLVKYLNVEVVFKLKQLFLTEKVQRDEGFKVELESMNEQSKERWEVVADINGTAIPLYFGIKYMNKLHLNTTGVKLTGEKDNVKILLMANIMKSKIDHSYYKLNQIKKYNWLTQESLDICTDRLKNLMDEGYIKKDGEFNESIGIEADNGVKFKLNGEMDYVDDNTVIEFKCVNKLDDSHFIQLLLYKYINEMNNKYYENYYVYNILSDELYKIECSFENLENIINILIKNKDNTMLDDRAFREQLRVEGLI